MVNKCVLATCPNSKVSNAEEDLHVFHFPSEVKRPDLYDDWVRFVNRCNGWNPSSSSVICHLHFEDMYINKGKRWSLRWNMMPVPNIYPEKLKNTPSILPTPQTKRKAPTERVFQEDELSKFMERDTISCLDDLTESRAPPGFAYRRADDHVVYYRLIFDPYPTVHEAICIDENLHVKLQYKGIPVPLPKFFTVGRTAKLTSVLDLYNFPSAIQQVTEENQYSILHEINENKWYRCQTYSAEVIRYALLLRHTSLQAYKLIREKFPLPSISMLNKIQQGGVDSIKALKILRDRGEMANDLVLLVDEMYLQKEESYQGGSLVGAAENGDLYKGIVVFMVVGLKESIPYVVQAVPEVTFGGKWLKEKIDTNLANLMEAGFCVRGVVTDNHSANVNAFNYLAKSYDSDSECYIKHPNNGGKKTYFFYDAPHLIKNIRNNLLNGKKFVFPEFKYDDGKNISLHCPAGYVRWGDLLDIHSKDEDLTANLKMAPKLSYQALHPGNKKQNVPLALAVFDETTIAAAKKYFPHRKDLSGFLTIFNTWWKITNSRVRYEPNSMGNAIEKGDGKTEFYRALADWIDKWCECPYFTLTRQTGNALSFTLRSQAMLIDELLSEDYEFVLTSRLQSDPLERRFSRYRQMSGGRFLVSLREVMNSERILSCRSLIKEDINFWKEDISAKKHVDTKVIDEKLENRRNEIVDCNLNDSSSEVATTIAGYVAKKLKKRSKCAQCQICLSAHDADVNNDSYLTLLSRGGLFVPSKVLSEYVCHCFAIIDHLEKEILSMSGEANRVRDVALYVLKKFGPKPDFTCALHQDWGLHFASKMIINCFFNNKQKLAKDSARQDVVVAFKKSKRQKIATGNA